MTTRFELEPTRDKSSRLVCTWQQRLGACVERGRMRAGGLGRSRVGVVRGNEKDEREEEEMREGENFRPRSRFFSISPGRGLLVDGTLGQSKEQAQSPLSTTTTCRFLPSQPSIFFCRPLYGLKTRHHTVWPYSCSADPDRLNPNKPESGYHC